MRKSLEWRKKLLWLAGIGAFGLIGIACFVVGYGLNDGWDAVLAWFVSKYAMWVYVFAALYVLFACLFLIWKRNEDIGNGRK